MTSEQVGVRRHQTRKHVPGRHDRVRAFRTEEILKRREPAVKFAESDSHWVGFGANLGQIPTP